MAWEWLRDTEAEAAAVAAAEAAEAAAAAARGRVPELPEVEVVRRGLGAGGGGPGRHVGGGDRGPDGAPPPGRSARRAPAGRPARSTAGRIGKFLLVPLDDGAETLVIHLRMSGRLLLTAPDRPMAKHTHAVLRLPDRRELRFVDPRTFGELFVLPGTVRRPAGRSGSRSLVGRLVDRRPAEEPGGPDGAAPAAAHGPAVRGRHPPIYSDEALFEALAAVRRCRLGSLSGEEVGRLHRAAAPLRDAVSHRGSSLRDAQYVDLFGAPGEYQNRHRVYGREGEPCPRCGGPVRRISLGGRSTVLLRDMPAVAARDSLRRRALIRGRVPGRGIPVVVPPHGRGRGCGRVVPQPARRSGGACFEGDPAAVERAVAWCREGPSSAIVTSVDVTPGDATGEQGFHLG